MSKNKVFKPSGDWIKKSHVDSLEKYEKIYHDSCLCQTLMNFGELLLIG